MSRFVIFLTLKIFFLLLFLGGASYYRPLVYVSYMVEYHFFRVNPFYFKLDNIILHWLTSICIFFIINTLFKEKFFGFFVALLFAIHPIHWEQISHVAGRSILLCGFWYLNAFLFFCLYANNRKKFYLFALSLFSFILSFLSKESAVTLPMILMSYELYLLKKETGSYNLFRLRMYQWGRLIPFGMVAVFFLLLRQFLGITNVPAWGNIENLFLGVFTFLRGFLTYLRLVIFPVGLHFDRSLMYFQSFRDPQLIVTVLFFVVVFVIFIRFRKKISPLTLFFFSWVCISFLTVSQVFPILSRIGYASVAEHFMYIPSVGIFTLIVLFVDHVLQLNRDKKFVSHRILWFSILTFFLFFFLVNIGQNIYSSQQLAVLKNSLEHNPNNVRIRNSYALELALKGLYQEAEEQYRIALRHEPGNVNSRISLGKALCDQGRLWEGIQEYEKMKHWDVGKHRKLLDENLKISYDNLIKKHLDELRENPNSPEKYFKVGVLYSKAERIEEGIEKYREALQVDLFHEDSLLNLIWSFETLGHYQKAIDYTERMLEIPSLTLETKDKLQSRIKENQQKIEDGLLKKSF